ncbi:MAG: DUF3857 and transglutaminase domain-containing protein [Chitinophagaceae bacterium]|nr:DUF3857 and transglutaminase domain-containing protein [Chitinophagaceae bacterium]
MLYRKFLLTVITLVAAVSGFAGDGDYAVSKIPEALMKNADVVMRLDETRFEVINLGKSVTKIKYAITVLNENGDRYSILYLGYDKLHFINSIDATLFDVNGKKIKGLKKSDIKDVSGTEGGTLADDIRYKVFGFYHKLYPYTVEYEIELQTNGTYSYPHWQPLKREKYAVEQSALTIVVPSDISFRYKALNYKGSPVSGTDKANKTYRWEVKNLQPIELEYASPSWDYIVPTVYTAPNKFKLEDYEGDMSTWEEYGKFNAQLNKGRDKLPDNIKQKVHELADGLKTDKEKIKALYEYMQQNTRYISIQLGIGGQQPYDATFVATKKYGDCKALSNYMYSLLKEVGIKSNYTLVKSGRGENYMLKDFPYDPFDHIILCVPLQKDTVWLECTNQIIPTGYLGGFTDDRYVLLVDEAGGKLVKTPKYTKQQNLRVRKINGKIGEDGMLTMNINSSYSGLQQDQRHGIFNSLSHDKQLEFLKQQIDLPHYDVVNFSFMEDKAPLPTLKEHLEVKALNYSPQTGKRLFVIPNVISRAYTKLKTSEDRKYPISLGMDYIDIDTTVVEIPQGYILEALPASLKLESKFGKFQCSTELKGNELIYYRYIEKNGGEFPASDYNDLVKFYDQIYKADRSRVVLVKKE